MCLAVPAKIIELTENDAVLEAMGTRFRANTSLVENLQIGDIVLVHAGFAISKVDPDQAEQTWKLFEKISDIQNSETPGQSNE